MTAPDNDDLKRAEGIYDASIDCCECKEGHDDCVNSWDHIAQALSEERARTLNSEAVQGLVDAAKLGLREAEETLVQIGGCDHSVNYCSCEVQKSVEEIKGALFKFQQFKDGK